MPLEVAVRKNVSQFSLDVTFALSAQRVGVFGPSGSGKSTLAHLIAGLQTPEAGEIRLHQECLFNHTRRIHQPVEQRRVGLVFQSAQLFPHLNVEKNLCFGWQRLPASERRVDFQQVVAMLQLEPLLTRGVEHLSGGEQQRVAIGRAVLANPQLLILDEPLSALDEPLKIQMITSLNAIQAAFNIPLLLISHSLLEMRLLTDVVLQLEQGRIMGLLSPEQLARQQMTTTPGGYRNLLKLRDPRQHDGLMVYRWGENEITTLAQTGGAEAWFELSSKDIILFKQHPKAISARNLLVGTVSAITTFGPRLGVELDCRGEKLIVEIVQSAAHELEIRPGVQLYAAFKASAISRVGG